MKPVTVYTTRTCPYCAAAKRLLSRKGIPFEEVDVTGDDAARAALVERSGGRQTVPQIFIDGAPIGGSDDLRALDASGRLDELVRDESPAPSAAPVE